MNSSVPDHVRSIVGRAGSRLTPGGGSSAPVQRRTHLSATQDGAALTVEFTLRGTDRAEAVYALADTDWVPCGDVEVAGSTGADTTYRARFDLAALAAATADHPVVAVAPTRPGSQSGDENLEGLRLKLFADVASPSGYVRPLGRVVDWSADGEVAGAGDPEGGRATATPSGSSRPPTCPSSRRSAPSTAPSPRSSAPRDCSRCWSGHRCRRRARCATTG